jgi:superfamily I DNA and/or RNA helicase
MLASKFVLVGDHYQLPPLVQVGYCYPCDMFMLPTICSSTVEFGRRKQKKFPRETNCRFCNTYGHNANLK